jgi:uncharacterized protein YxeA
MQAIKYILITILSLIIIESVFLMVNRNNGKVLPFLYDTNSSKGNDNDPNHFEINPLLGWSNKNFKSFENNGKEILLKYHNDKDEPIQIYISGGSTTDLMLDSTNWPIFLLEEFKRKKISVEIAVASVGGYSSGQELLKLITRKQNKIDLHISYSGANEADSPSYITNNEYENFNKLLHPSPKILPNTISFFQKPNQFTLSGLDIYNPEDFWIENMSKMNYLALGSGYKFVGILQPVAGIFSKIPSVMPEGSERYLPLYKKMYPKVIQQLKDKNYIVDFSKIFISHKKSPFKDDCHLKDQVDQKLIAKKVADICFKIKGNEPKKQ